MSKILATGATGFIGRALVRKLRENDHEVLPLSRQPDRVGVDLLDGVQVNVMNIQSARKEITEFAPEVVYHLAAQGMTEPNGDLQTYAAVNTMGTANVLDMAREVGAHTFVYATTCYEGCWIHEKPSSIYAATKAAGRMLCLGMRDEFINMVVARIFCVYGPGQAEAAFISKMIRNRLATPPMKVKKAYRDYIYIADVADALYDAMAVSTGEYDVGSGASLYLPAIAGSILARLDGGEFEEVEPEDGEPIALVAYKPNILRYPEIDFQTGLNETIDWHERRNI